MHGIIRLFARLHFIRFGIRDRILRIFCNPDKQTSKKFEVDFFGRKYVGDLSNFIDWNVYFLGAYSKQELILMLDVLKDNTKAVVLDIGANIGHHTLFASTIAQNVYSFEPYPAVYKKIYEKIQINNLKNVKVFEVGLGSVDNTLYYNEPDGCNFGTGSFVETSISNNTTQIKLPVRNGDSFLNAEGIKKVDFIKMDIEGFEYEALVGLKETLIHNRPVIFFEWSASSRGINCKLDELFPENYLIYQFLIDVPFLFVFNNSDYKLKKETVNFSDGNKVAIPIERLPIMSSHID